MLKSHLITGILLAGLSILGFGIVIFASFDYGKTLRGLKKRANQPLWLNWIFGPVTRSAGLPEGPATPLQLIVAAIASLLGIYMLLRGSYLVWLWCLKEFS